MREFACNVLYLKEIRHEGTGIEANDFLKLPRFKATDPKDHVYGTLGVTRIDVVPDYTRTVSEIYFKYLQQIFLHTSDLLFLRYAGVAVNPSNEFNLPSWSPNWHALSEARGGRPTSRGFKADRGISEHGCEQAVLTETILHVSGVCCDIISRVEEAHQESYESHFRFCCQWVKAYLEHRFPRDSRRTTDLLSVDGVPLLVLFRLLTVSNGERGFWIESATKDGFRKHWLAFVDYLSAGSSGTRDDERLQLLGLTGSEWATSLNKHVVSQNITHEEVTVKWRLFEMSRFRFFWTDTGYVGMAPKGLANGDTVCVLNGSDVPVLLRKVEDHYVMVSTCYVLDIRDGEAIQMVKAGQAKIERFEIH